MEVLWESKSPLKPAEVKAKLTGEYAYTTIMTVLKRMADKKLINRSAQGNTYFYSPCMCKTEFAADTLDYLFTRLFETYGVDVVKSFTKIAKEQKYSI